MRGYGVLYSLVLFTLDLDGLSLEVCRRKEVFGFGIICSKIRMNRSRESPLFFDYFLNIMYLLIGLYRTTFLVLASHYDAHGNI